MKNYLAIVIGLACLPAPSRADCGSEFAPTECKDSEIRHKISEYKRGSSSDVQRLEALSSKGAAVVPYVAKLACKRKLHFYFMNMKAGIFGWYHDYAYVPHAQSVLGGITDPGAIPNLSKIVLEPRIGTQAQEAIVRLQGSNSSVSKEVLKKIIDRDARNWLAIYGVNLERYSQLMQAYPPDEKAEVILYLFNPRKLAPGLSFAGAQNIHNMTDLQRDGWLKIIRMLADSGSSVARTVLEQHEASLVAALKEYEHIFNSERIMSQRTDTGRENAAKDIERTQQMLAAYRSALASVGNKN